MGFYPVVFSPTIFVSFFPFQICQKTNLMQRPTGSHWMLLFFSFLVNRTPGSHLPPLPPLPIVKILPPLPRPSSPPLESSLPSSLLPWRRFCVPIPGFELLWRHTSPHRRSPPSPLLFFHNGGFKFLSLDSCVVDALCRRICQKVNIVIASLNYQLSLEHWYLEQMTTGRTCSGSWMVGC